MTRPKKIVLITALHTLLWFVFLFLPAPYSQSAGSFGITSIFSELLEPSRSYNAVLLIALFYFNYYYAIPRLYFKKKYSSLALSALLFLLFFFILNYLLLVTHVHTENENQQNAIGTSLSLFMFIVVYAASFGLSLYKHWLQIKDQVVETELSFLKAQISPHFLFNTLNSIYSLALTKSDSAPEAIVKLSGLMRYSISESGQDKVSLQQEINYITNYIDLQKLRLTHKIKISYTVDGHIEGKIIAPFLLIPFIENAFKHGVNSEENSDIKIKIVITSYNILLEVVNNKVYLRYNEEKGTNIGIATTRKRLELLYPGNHSLNIENNNHEFKVSLKITL